MAYRMCVACVCTSFCTTNGVDMQVYGSSLRGIMIRRSFVPIGQQGIFTTGARQEDKAWSGLSGDIGQWLEGLFFSLSVCILAFSVFLFFATQAHGDEVERTFTGWVQKGHTRYICNGVAHVQLVGLGHSYFMFSGLLVMRKLRRAAC